MSDDKIFPRKLEELVRQLEQAGVTRHVMVSNIKASNLEVKGNMTQKASKGGTVEQVIGADLEVSEDVKFDGNLTQES